jgi:hypothetical protein
MAHPIPMTRCVVHTVEDEKLFFTSVTLEIDEETGWVVIQSENMPNKKFLFSQINYIEADYPEV